LQTGILQVSPLMVAQPQLAKCHVWLHSQTKNLFLVADKIGEQAHQVQLLDLAASIPHLTTAKVAFAVLGRSV
jgi:hypothetical protein